MEGDARDDAMTLQMELEGGANIMKEGVGVDSMTPQIGMEFPTHDAAYEFYNRYALKIGFQVRQSSTNVSKTDKNEVISRKFVCCEEGYRNDLANREGVVQDVHNRQLRVGCNARMKIVHTDSNTWKVSVFVRQHDNHGLTSPSKTSKQRSHKKVYRKPVVKTLMTRLHSEGKPNSDIARVANVLESSQDDIVTAQQVHDHLRVERKNNIDRNCSKVIKHFQEKQQNDPNFYFSFEVSEDLTLRSVLWADGRSRESYMKFSDVIVFDVTYRTNSFSLPFAPFTGINHHRQSSLFGCALLADETEETFVWLFQQWLTCMHDKAPGAIITIQDDAIGNAIARVFPNSRHRYCDWHLDRNIGEHMVHLKALHGLEFEVYFNRLRGSESIPEAEECWKELMTRYKLQEKSWLPKLWDRRESWIFCYLKDIFFAGTRTSQRAESINTFFDSFVNAKKILHEFVIQYDKTLASRRAAEEDADFHTMDSKPVLTLGWQVEKQAERCYTKVVFDIFKQELEDAKVYWAEKKHKEGTLTRFTVGRPQSDRSRWRNVTYDSDGVVVYCDCKLFEFTGLLCSHALHIFWKKHITEIPDRYILKRWTIDARYQRVSVDVRDSAPTKMDQNPYWRMRYKCDKVLEACKSPTIAEEFDTYLSKKLVEIDIKKKAAQPVKFDVEEFVSQVGSTTTPTFQNIDLFPPEISIHDPTECVKTKGRPRTTTIIQSGLEVSQAESRKKQRTCGFCKEKGHYRTGCAKAKASAATTSDHQFL